MFTGIVEATGVVRLVEVRDTTRRLRIEAGSLAPELGLGDSVAVDGACLTVTDVDRDGFHVDVIGTTLERTIAGGYHQGTVVNLERAVRIGDRLDGHLVQGHVDGTAIFLDAEQDGEYWRMDFRLPEDVAGQTIPRGSITLNGVSLTVADLRDDALCRIGIIPFTKEHTNLGALAPGDRVNVEGDLIGKYVGKMLAPRQSSPRP